MVLVRAGMGLQQLGMGPGRSGMMLRILHVAPVNIHIHLVHNHAQLMSFWDAERDISVETAGREKAEFVEVKALPEAAHANELRQ